MNPQSVPRGGEYNGLKSAGDSVPYREPPASLVGAATRPRALLPPALTGLSPALPLPPLPGTWAQPFDPESTREENFYVNESTVVTVPTMFQSSPIKYLKDRVLPCQLVQLDYTGNGTVFFILPDEGEMDTVIAALSRDTIQRWSESLTIR